MSNQIKRPRVLCPDGKVRTVHNRMFSTSGEPFDVTYLQDDSGEWSLVKTEELKLYPQAEA